MIEVGEYVRTNEGIIDKVDSFNINTNIYHCKNGLCIDKENKIAVSLKEVKHSKKLIDLIEVGDYVNGNKVVQTYKDSKKQDEIYLEVVVSSIMIKEPLTDYIEADRIKTILTKEQYLSNCYTVERKE